MDSIYINVILHLFAAVAAGGLIGLERSYQGRPAGFRTHSLVCLASSLLMLLTIYQIHLLPNIPVETMRIDPTRMAQGIMTGIGFLGAGVIMKDNVTIRGLTTAASIWITAAIGILIGIGFYSAAVLATVLTLGALSVFRWLEAVLPGRHYARVEIRARAANPFSLDELRELFARFQCSFSNPGYALVQDGGYFCYDLTLRTRRIDSFYQLAEALRGHDKVGEFRIHPASE